MARDRTSALRDLPAPPPPPDVPELVDVDRDRRQRRILTLLACGTREKEIVRSIAKEYGVRPAQVQQDMEDVRAEVRRHLDDEGAIDAVVLGAAARLHDMAHRFTELALAPIEDRVREVPGPNADDPDQGAVYRPLTPGERASEVGARANAANTAIRANEALTKLIGRRSARWSEKPSAVVVTSVEGLSAEDRELLRSLGMGAPS